MRGKLNCLSPQKLFWQLTLPVIALDRRHSCGTGNPLWTRGCQTDWRMYRDNKTYLHNGFRVSEVHSNLHDRYITALRNKWETGLGYSGDEIQSAFLWSEINRNEMHMRFYSSSFVNTEGYILLVFLLRFICFTLKYFSAFLNPNICKTFTYSKKDLPDIWSVLVKDLSL